MSTDTTHRAVPRRSLSFSYDYATRAIKWGETAAGGVLWLALGEAFAEPGEGAVPVGGAEHVEVPIAERVRLATGGAPQRTTLRLAASTRAPVAVRRLALYTAHTRLYTAHLPTGASTPYKRWSKCTMKK